MMQTWLLKFWLPGLTAAGISWITSKWVIKKGRDWGIVDDPKTHKLAKVVHTQAVPRGGGIPIWAALLGGSLVFLPWTQRVAGILLGSLILTVTGFADDRYEEKISPYLRLGLNIAAAAAVIGAGIGIAYINNPLGGIIHLDWPRYCLVIAGEARCIWLLADIFALVWLVWMQNIIGWSSGVDGQMPGFVVITAVVMALLAGRYAGDANQWIVITLAGITAGAYAGFWPMNWYPQKIIPGYGGKALAGFLLGTMAIMTSAKVGAMVLVLGVPMVDAVLVIVKRLREGRSPVWGGRDHLHHYLLDMGWSKKQIALFYLALSAVFGILAWRLQAPAKYFTMATVILLVAGGVLWLHYWSIYLKQPGPDNG